MGLALDVSDLRVAGDEGRTILAIDALSLPAGRSLGVRGPSGAGKSTFLYAIAGLLARAQGGVRWGEDDLLALGAGARARFRRRRMGFVFQDFLLFEEMSAAENAALVGAFAAPAARRAIRARARQDLAGFGVPGRRRAVRHHSGGERQRIALARALAAGPAILLADEPTASLDRATKEGLVDDLVSRARDNAISFVAVSHDEMLLDAMDRVITIEDGTLKPS